MDKKAPAEFPIHDLIAKRWSPRAFAAKPIAKEAILSLFEAARWAPSCFNEQPWFFLIAVKEDEGEFGKMLSCLVEANQVWAKTAPLLMISIAKLNFDKNGKPNRHAVHDVGLAAENMSIQAAAQGLCLHQMAGFDTAKTKEVFSIPEGYEPVAAIAGGYPGEAKDLPANLAEKEAAPRVRKRIHTFAYTGRWGNPFLDSGKMKS